MSGQTATWNLVLLCCSCAVLRLKKKRPNLLLTLNPHPDGFIGWLASCPRQVKVEVKAEGKRPMRKRSKLAGSIGLIGLSGLSGLFG